MVCAVTTSPPAGETESSSMPLFTDTSKYSLVLMVLVIWYLANYITHYCIILNKSYYLLKRSNFLFLFFC